MFMAVVLDINEVNALLDSIENKINDLPVEIPMDLGGNDLKFLKDIVKGTETIKGSLEDFKSTLESSTQSAKRGFQTIHDKDQQGG